MANDNEPAKLLLPYLQRADELQKHDPLVAYYCRLYAMERGLKIPQSERTKYTNSLLVSLMKQLEKDKKSLKLGPDDSLHLEGFALNVFAKADKQDRAGRADLNTAKTFYAASIFFEILNQFGELQPDVEQKQKYAAWKAVDIRKAMKEGRKPEPGPPGGDRDLSVPLITPSSEYDLEPNRIDPTTKHLPESDPSPHYNDQVDPQHFVNSPQPPPPSNILQPPPSNIPPPPPSNIPPPPHYNDRVDPQHFVNSPPPQAPPTNIPPSPPSYPSSTYTSHDFHPPPSTTLSDNSSYSQSYHHQPYPQEPPQHFTQNYPSHDVPSYSYPNFQSYPSFTESNLPEAPSHYPSFNHGSEASYSNPSAPTKMDYPPSDQYDSGSRNGSVSEATPKPIQTYLYDSNYQPPPEKIAEAHKAARFAVGALAFDDVYIAVDYLKKSLELLTNPSAGQ